LGRVKRILRIIGSADPRSGGPIEGVLRSSLVLRDLGRETEIVTTDRPGEIAPDTTPFQVHTVGSGWFPQRYAPRLTSWLERNLPRFDVAIVHGLWNAASVGSLGPLARSGVPYFVFTHGMMDPWFKAHAPAKHAAKQGLWLASQGRLLKGAEAVLFTAEEERERARDAFWGHAYRAEVVGYGAAEPPSASGDQAGAFAKAVPDLEGRPYLLFMSRIHAKKGCDILVRAFARACAQDADLQLVIAGPDQQDLGASLRKEADRAGVGDRIHWPGMLAGDAKWGAIRGAQAFVLPSHQENFGIVLAEAMACGVPVITTDKVNIWREIAASGAGIVSSDDEVGVEASLRTFLSQSPQARAAAQKAARTIFEAQFDVRRTTPRLLDLIERLT
jgi:glycosyltransferase involved in cell wall biosynthesis